MKRSTDPRHQARILALQELYSKYFNSQNDNLEEISIEELIGINEMEE